MTKPIRIEVVGESRSDYATRTIELVENAPRYSYERSGTWRKPGSRTVTWEVARVRLTWDRGVLKRADVLGYRLKKDGTVGVVKEHAYFRPTKEDPSRLTAHLAYDREPTSWDWLNTLVAEHSTPPPFDGTEE